MKKPAFPYRVYGDAIAIHARKVAHASPSSAFHGQAVDSPDSLLPAPVFVHLLPLSGFKGRDGRGPFYYAFPELAQAFKARGLKLAIDLEHASLEASKTGAVAPALGWIVDLELTDAGVFGKVEWTPTGRALVESGGFKYLSPVFASERLDGGRIFAVLGAGLTHLPNLSLKPVTMKELEMNEETLKLLLEILELPAESGAAEILAGLKTLKLELEDFRSLFADLNKGEGEGEDEDEGETVLHGRQDVLGILTAMQAEQKRLSAAVLALSANTASAKQAAHSEACARAVDAAIAGGKIPPAGRAFHLQSAKHDLAAFKRFIAAAPVFPGFGKQSAHRSAATSASSTPAKSPFDVALKRQ
ncbi:MAG: phage protease [Zoogloeaceae bacterium]|nr:phage protease [Zoogloeaceae bacterium]